MEIQKRVDEAILKESLKDERVRKYLYASDVFGCQRKILLEYNGLKAGGFDARTLRIFDNGNAVHERIIKYLTLAGLEPQVELSLEPNEPNIHGRLDAKITEDEKLKLVEIKSINLRVVKEAKEEHIAQLHIYMHYTGIHEGYLIYESKQTQELFFFPITFDSLGFSSFTPSNANFGSSPSLITFLS